MKIYILLFMIALGFMNCKSQDEQPLQIGDVFPRLEAQTLDDNKIIFPDNTKGKLTFLATGFSQDAQIPINSWSTYMLKNHPSVDFYELPIGNEYFAVFSRAIDNKMKTNVPKELHAKTATYYGSLCKTYQQQFGVTDMNTCYIFLLDKEGKIIFKTSGPLNKVNQSAIEKELK